MNRLFVMLAVLGFLLSNTAFGQGPRFSHKQGGRIKKVFFLDNTHGWTAEDGARSRSTIDGGQTWEYGFTEDDFREELSNVFFLNTLDGWAVSLGGSVLRTFNGGDDWVKINTDPAVILDVKGQPARLNTIFMFDDFVTGWIGGDDGTLLRTFDGGENWLPAPNLPPGFQSGNDDPEDAYKIRFWDASLGYMVADYFHAYRTINGGTDWIPVDVEPVAGPCGATHNLELWDFDFGDSLTNGFMVGGVGVQEGFIFKTIDGGASWSMTSCFDQNPGMGDCNPPTVYGVARVGTWPSAVGSGYASQVLLNQVGTAAVFDSCLCGAPSPGSCPETWKRLNTPSDFQAVLFGLDRVGSTSTVCATGNFGAIRLVDTASLSITDVGTKDYIRLEAGDFTSGSTGCVAGQASVIKRTNNSGLDWAQVYPAPPTLPSVNDPWVRDLQFSGANGVAVGDAGFTAWSNTSGASWTPNPVGTFNFQCAAFVPGTLTVFAGAANGVLRKSINGGVTWTTPTQPGTAMEIRAIAFADAQNGYLVGGGEIAFQTTNGGGTWFPVETVDNGVTTEFYGVATWGNGTPAMAVGSNGRIYEKTGARFNALGTQFVSSTLTDVEVFASGTDLHIRICGSAGAMLFRDNGVWSQPKSQTNEDHKALSFISADLGYGIGTPFLITKYE
jgi:photosystem II stability/assembly factor-like uncharacterized protein